MSTYILEGLLGAVLVLTLASWALAPRPDVLPRSPTSIANILSLAAGGNLLELMADKKGSLHSRSFFDNYRFWLGWRTVPSTAEGRDGHGQKRFSIWVLTPEELELAKREESKADQASKVK